MAFGFHYWKIFFIMFRRFVHTASRPCCGVDLIPSTYEYPFGSSYPNHLYPQPLLYVSFWIYTSASWWSQIDHPYLCISTPPRSYLHTNTNIHRIDVDEMFSMHCDLNFELKAVWYYIFFFYLCAFSVILQGLISLMHKYLEFW